MQIKQQTSGYNNIPFLGVIYVGRLWMAALKVTSMGDVHTVEEERPLLEVACIYIYVAQLLTRYATGHPVTLPEYIFTT